MEQQSKRTNFADISRVDHLLKVLSSLSEHDPSPALRNRLEILAALRLKNAPNSGKRSGFLIWLRPALALTLLVAIGLVVTFISQIRQPERLRAGIELKIPVPNDTLGNEIHAPPAVPDLGTKSLRARHSVSTVAQNVTPRRMIVRLPYSNNAIDTGTDTTIRVSMSQAELASLGFPMNTTIQDHRIVAELTIGDDGLPRAISVSLPLEVIKEKK